MARSQELAHLFQQPDSPAHRRYEICRAYFYESAPADEIAKRFHRHPDSVRAIVRDFARAPTSTRCSPPLGLAPRRLRNAMRSTSEPVLFAAKVPPWLTSAPPSNRTVSMSVNRICFAS